MASLAVSNNFLVLSTVSEATIVVKRSEKSEKIVLALPQQCDDSKKKNISNDSDYENERVVVKISPSEKYIAVCYGKKLSIWCTKDWKLLNSRDIVRAASNIIFTPSEEQLVLADKSGDVYSFNLSDNESGVLILGHLSVVLDVLVTKDEKFIITCDRDEKIRVSNFPNAYNIQGYCLGHKEFVSSIKFLPHDETVLLSGSGDGTVKFWSIHEGLEICSFLLSSLPCNIVPSDDNCVSAVGSISVLKRNVKSSLVCLNISKLPKIVVLLAESDYNRLVCNYHSVINVMTDDIIFDICVPYLWILSGESVAQLTLLEWSNNDDTFTEKKNILDNILANVNVDIKHIFCTTKKQNSFEYLYKKKYDNVQEYLVKKKARIEATAS